MTMKAVVILLLISVCAGIPQASIPKTDIEDDEDIQTELGKKLQVHLDDILEKIKDSIEKGKAVKEDLLDKVKEIREKLKELKVDIGTKAKELLEKIKEKVKDFWKKVLEKLGLKDD